MKNKFIGLQYKVFNFFANHEHGFVVNFIRAVGYSYIALDML